MRRLPAAGADSATSGCTALPSCIGRPMLTGSGTMLSSCNERAPRADRLGASLTTRPRRPPSAMHFCCRIALKASHLPSMQTECVKLRRRGRLMEADGRAVSPICPQNADGRFSAGRVVTHCACSETGQRGWVERPQPCSLKQGRD